MVGVYGPQHGTGTRKWMGPRRASGGPSKVPQDVHGGLRRSRNDCEYRWVSDQGVARYDEHGKFAGYIGTAVDVTELINKDAALRESEERMRLAADAVN